MSGVSQQDFPNNPQAEISTSPNTTKEPTPPEQQTSNNSNQIDTMEPSVDNAILRVIGLDNPGGRNRVQTVDWNKNAGPGDDEQTLTNYVIRVMYEAASCSYVDQDAFEWFKDYFEEWTVMEFNRMEKTIRTKLKSFLQYCGIYVDHHSRKTISVALAELLAMERRPAWPKGTRTDKNFSPLSKMNSINRNDEESGDGDHLPTPTHDAPSVPARTPGVSPGRTTIRPTPPPVITQSQPEIEDPYTKLPPNEYGREPIDAEAAMRFAKIWDKSERYSGERYDILDDKVLAFLRTCRLVGIKPGQCWVVFPEMLTGHAKAYYTHHVKVDASFAEGYWAL